MAQSTCAALEDTGGLPPTEPHLPDKAEIWARPAGTFALCLLPFSSVSHKCSN